MTLKKFLKKHRGYKQIIILYFDGNFVSRFCETDEAFHANTIDYSEYRVGKFWTLPLDSGKIAICIDLKPPKKRPQNCDFNETEDRKFIEYLRTRCVDDKAVKAFDKRNAGLLKVVSVRGNAETFCCKCRYADKSADEKPCKDCCNNYVDCFEYRERG